jgi:RHS repeat-associated protein
MVLSLTSGSPRVKKNELTPISAPVLDSIIYDPYGNIVSQTASSYADRFMFAGMQYDTATGLYYDHARYYDAAIGRFTSQDPKGFAAGDTDLYRYVGNTPTVGTDPTGMGENWYPGQFTVGAGFGGPAGINYITEKDPPTLVPLPGPGGPTNSDGLVLPGVGLIKIRGGWWTPTGSYGSAVKLVSFNPTTGEYTIQASAGSGPGSTPTFYPIGTYNPFGPGLGNVPGNGGVDEGSLPSSTNTGKPLVPYPLTTLTYIIGPGGKISKGMQ